jgi:hypothetical protein
MYNLNDASFDAAEGKAIFNKGVAGVAENITMTIVKRKAEDKPGSPEYKLVFTDAEGGSCNTSFWYVEKDTDYATIADQIQKQGKVLKHVIHAIYGDTYQFPNGFNSAKELLDGCMLLIRDGLAAAPKFRVFANYGSTQGVKKYIQPRSWVPFMEPMTVAVADTRLKAGNIDAMERIQEDSFVAPTSGAASADSIVEGDDW